MRTLSRKLMLLAAVALALVLATAACKPKADDQAPETPKAAAEAATPAIETPKPAAEAAKPAATPAEQTAKGAAEAPKAAAGATSASAAAAPAPIGEATALFETSLGNFTVRLYTDKAPNTAGNFIGLAEGKKAWMDPSSNQMVNKPMFDGRKIFRIVKGFMFQTGSGNDTGAYDPGFNLEDEIAPGLSFDKPGIVAMANTGRPNSAGSQFFVTTGAECRRLDGQYAIFGEVTEGMDTVMKIDSVAVTANPEMNGEISQPTEMPIIKKVTIKHGK